ncbi:MAG: membrane protein insertase YidC [Pseudomonadales bacterium]
MDFIRYALIGGLIFVSLSLANQWQQFKATGPQTSPSVTTEDAGLTTSLADVPTLNSSANNTDLPSIDENAPVPDSRAADKPEIADSEKIPSRLITVNTDVLLVKIDPQGGDIVHVALPQHLTSLEDDAQAFVLLEQHQQRVYIAQSGLIGPDGIDGSGERPVFTSEQNTYSLTATDSVVQVDLLFSQPGKADIIKRFEFQRGDYTVNVSYLINNKSDEPWRGNMFAQIKRDNSADPGTDTGAMGMQPFLGVATTSIDEPYIKMDFDDIAEQPYQADIPGGWIAMVQHYFISAWIPAADQNYRYATTKTQNGANIIRYTGPRTVVKPGQQLELRTQFYAGPKDQYKLETLSPGLELTVDYGWLWWIAQPLFWLLTKLHGLIGNWGWAIVALTFLIKAAFFHLSATSYKSMANMRKLQPKMMELRERYGDDRQKMSQETMALYQKEKINPLGGCLPILVQMPVFIALYWVLMESVELRHAPFAFWIKDLAAMDPYFVLPLIMGVTMWFQQKLNPPPPDPMQARVFQWMPVVFTFLFLWFPSGLVLYWVTNNILSMTQQWIITRRIENA